MRELFVATSYHHILTAIAKKYENKSSMDVLISNLITGDEYWFKYLDKLKNSGLLDNIYYYDGKKYPHPKPYNIFKTYYYEFFGEKKIIKSIEGFDPLQYDLVYLIEDKAFPSSTIIRNNKPYHLCEDSACSFYNLEKSKSYKYLLLPYSKFQFLFTCLKFWHTILGNANCCKAIETSTLYNLPRVLPLQKIILVDRKKLINSLPNHIKEKIVNIFIDKQLVSELVLLRNSVMILTSIYSIKINYDEQRKVLKKVMNKFKDSRIVIKPHPRDNTDYNSVINNAIIIDRFFPTEILNFLDSFRVNTVVSINSTASNICDFADAIVNISLTDIVHNRINKI